MDCILHICVTVVTNITGVVRLLFVLRAIFCRYVLFVCLFVFRYNFFCEAMTKTDHGFLECSDSFWHKFWSTERESSLFLLCKENKNIVLKIVQIAHFSAYMLRCLPQNIFKLFHFEQRDKITVVHCIIKRKSECVTLCRNHYPYSVGCTFPVKLSM